jgi:hypothetical protein
VTKLWASEKELKTLVAGLLARTKSDERKIDEAVRLGILGAEAEQNLRSQYYGVIDAGFAAALEQRAARKSVSPHVLPDRDPMSRFLNGIVASGKDGHR